MHETLLETFKVITGLPEDYILQSCDMIPLDNQVVLEFYMHFRRFPSWHEATFISDIGLSNFNALRIEGIDIGS